MAYDSLIEMIKPGEPVTAGITNRPTRTLDNRTNYLLQVLKASALGSTVVARAVTIDSAAVVGSPVFWDASNSRYGLGLANVAIDLATGQLTTADSAQIWGVVLTKSAATKADLLLLGVADLDITPALDAGEVLAAGSYYLSRTAPGRLTAHKPPVGIPVLKSDGLGGVFVAPQWVDLLASHTHLHYALRPLPAGEVIPPSPGDVHTISNPTAAIEGWLPADHAIFASKAPYGARFGYNWRANPGLKAAWPPLPPEDAILLQDGVELNLGNAGEAIIDRNGIWWLSNCYGEVPWPADLVTTASEISEWSASSTSNPCYDYRMKLDLYFTRYGFLTENTVVTSLVSRDNRIVIRCAGSPDQPASLGPLEIALDLSFSVGATGDESILALKNLDPATQVFSHGPVATGVYALSSALILSGNTTRTLTIGGTPQTVYSGIIGIDVDTGLDHELFANLVRLDGVLEQYDEDVMYLGFPVGLLTAMRVRIPVPATLTQVNPQLTLKFRLLGRGAGTLPALTLTYRRVPASNTVVALPGSDTAVALTYTATITNDGDYLDVASDAFTVAAGDDVFFTLQRSASDSYAFEVGVERISGTVSSA